MLFLFWLFLFLAGTCLILLLPALWGEQIYHEYREGRTVNFPETHSPVSVRFNALKAAWSTLSGSPRLRLACEPSLQLRWFTFRGIREELSICRCC